MWPQLIMAGVGAFSKYKQGQANEKFERQQIDVQNEEARDSWNRQQEKYYASVAAEMARMQGNVEAGRAGLQSRQDAFGLTKEAEEKESEQRAKFAKALIDFGKENKKANLTEAKAKRSGRASKAAKGAKVLGTAGRAGRLSGAFRKGARAAVGAGLEKAATTAGMQAALTGYGADLDREFGLFGDLSAEGAVVGGETKAKRALGRYRTELGGQEEKALRDQAGAAYTRDMTEANRLGIQPVRQTYAGKPDYGIWDKVGPIADMAGTYYGLKAGQPPTSGPGVTYGAGSPHPGRYTGANAPYLPSPKVRNTRQYQGY